MLFIKSLRYYACADWSIELLKLYSIVPVNTQKSGYVSVPAENDENFHNLNVVSAFVLETEGDNQN